MRLPETPEEKEEAKENPPAGLPFRALNTWGVGASFVLVATWLQGPTASEAAVALLVGTAAVRAGLARSPGR